VGGGGRLWRKKETDREDFEIQRREEGYKQKKNKRMKKKGWYG
jgi:hypothetical protein